MIYNLFFSFPCFQIDLWYASQQIMCGQLQEAYSILFNHACIIAYLSAFAWSVIGHIIVRCTSVLELKRWKCSHKYMTISTKHQRYVYPRKGGCGGDDAHYTTKKYYGNQLPAKVKKPGQLYCQESFNCRELFYRAWQENVVQDIL